MVTRSYTHCMRMVNVWCGVLRLCAQWSPQCRLICSGSVCLHCFFFAAAAAAVRTLRRRVMPLVWWRLPPLFDAIRFGLPLLVFCFQLNGILAQRRWVASIRVHPTAWFVLCVVRFFFCLIAHPRARVRVQVQERIAYTFTRTNRYSFLHVINELELVRMDGAGEQAQAPCKNWINCC